ncbi:MAG: 50S ribosome-binding GTPase, partial [Synergistaceae bacterium]|nr:50S ribosome-binding GTPase [Synergistaceae bacterium]
MSEQSVFKFGFVVLLGRPNVGKSSLINALLREKVAAVSDKPQTTRNAVRCIHSTETAQIVFVDTPGVHTPRHALGNYMMHEVEEALQEVNAVCFVVEAGRNRLDPQEEQIISILETSD